MMILGSEVNMVSKNIDIDYITFRNVSKQFNSGNNINQILKSSSLKLNEGSFSVVVGPSGTGKTTLLNMIAGFDKPTSGEILIAGNKIIKPSPKHSVVFQSPTLFPWKTILGNIFCALDHKKLPKKTKLSLCDQILDEVGLSNYKKHYPHELSGGMQQRVGIARALIMLPDILLMDEPFSALDHKTREDMQDLVINIWLKHGLTILFVTHSIEEAVKISTDVLILKNGSVEVIKNNVNHPRAHDDNDLMKLKYDIEFKIKHAD
ncbi:ABC transporter ATP-binding protein [Acidithiobacillus thiooxidans]|uniref:ABC transporter ATP-binding protein n=1 Tax=Acidithiobacillus sulfurivorans TaxID=1958756 RepID=A0ABS6A2Q9_9PROT|nr:MULTISPECIES: ABC transporter ATP-binding protein [Acidithiobacillus]MBU2761540.1 ABC transporter ATP-binding protein [Acidithiobacillus sulfurivorans]MBU2837888.1 ABC transporter ATP-binding protein [Acidithiobacillus thiooxidans]